MTTTFPDKLKALRKAQKVTQVQLAGIIGMSPGTVAMWETAQRKPTCGSLIFLSHYFGVTIDELLGYTQTQDPNSSKTNFEAWKERLTPEDVAHQQFIVLSCGACPASGITCNKYDTTCRGNFLLWAKAKVESKNEEAAE